MLFLRHDGGAPFDGADVRQFEHQAGRIVELGFGTSMLRRTDDAVPSHRELLGEDAAPNDVRGLFFVWQAPVEVGGNYTAWVGTNSSIDGEETAYIFDSAFSTDLGVFDDRFISQLNKNQEVEVRIRPADVNTSTTCIADGSNFEAPRQSTSSGSRACSSWDFQPFHIAEAGSVFDFLLLSRDAFGNANFETVEYIAFVFGNASFADADSRTQNHTAPPPIPPPLGPRPPPLLISPPQAENGSTEDDPSANGTALAGANETDSLNATGVPPAPNGTGADATNLTGAVDIETNATANETGSGRSGGRRRLLQNGFNVTGNVTGEDNATSALLSEDFEAPPTNASDSNATLCAPHHDLGNVSRAYFGSNSTRINDTQFALGNETKGQLPCRGTSRAGETIGAEAKDDHENKREDTGVDVGSDGTFAVRAYTKLLFSIAPTFLDGDRRLFRIDMDWNCTDEKSCWRGSRTEGSYAVHVFKVSGSQSGMPPPMVLPLPAPPLPPPPSPAMPPENIAPAGNTSQGERANITDAPPSDGNATNPSAIAGNTTDLQPSNTTSRRRALLGSQALVNHEISNAHDQATRAMPNALLEPVQTFYISIIPSVVIHPKNCFVAINGGGTAMAAAPLDAYGYTRLNGGIVNGSATGLLRPGVRTGLLHRKTTQVPPLSTLSARRCACCANAPPRTSHCKNKWCITTTQAPSRRCGASPRGELRGLLSQHSLG